MTEETSESALNVWSQRSYNWAIYTWVGNLIGCFIALVPIALPIGIAMTGVTLIMGFVAFFFGLRGLKVARDEDDAESRTYAWIGIGLSMAHLVIVAVVGTGAYVLLGELR